MLKLNKYAMLVALAAANGLVMNEEANAQENNTEAKAEGTTEAKPCFGTRAKAFFGKVLNAKIAQHTATAFVSGLAVFFVMSKKAADNVTLSMARAESALDDELGRYVAEDSRHLLVHKNAKAYLKLMANDLRAQVALSKAKAAESAVAADATAEKKDSLAKKTLAAETAKTATEKAMTDFVTNLKPAPSAPAAPADATPVHAERDGTPERPADVIE